MNSIVMHQFSKTFCNWNLPDCFKFPRPTTNSRLRHDFFCSQVDRYCSIFQWNTGLHIVCLFEKIKASREKEFPRSPFQKHTMKMQQSFKTRWTEISLTSFRWVFTPQPLLKRILARLLRLAREPGSLSLKYEQLDWWCWQRWKWKSRRKWQQPGSTFNSTSKANFCAKQSYHIYWYTQFWAWYVPGGRVTPPTSTM